MHQCAFLRHQKARRAVLLQIGRHRRIQRFLVVARVFRPGLRHTRRNAALHKIMRVINVRGAVPLEIGAGQRFPEIAMAAKLNRRRQGCQQQKKAVNQFFHVCPFVGAHSKKADTEDAQGLSPARPSALAGHG